MPLRVRLYRRKRHLYALLVFAFAWVPHAPAQNHIYNAHIVEGGPPLRKLMPAEVARSRMRSIALWLKDTPKPAAEVEVVQAGNEDEARVIAIRDLHVLFRTGRVEIVAPTPLEPAVWHQVVAVEDGDHSLLYVDGRLAGSGAAIPGPNRDQVTPNGEAQDAAASKADSDVPELGETSPQRLTLAPLASAPRSRFAGYLAHVTVVPQALGASEIAADFQRAPDLRDCVFEENAKPWPLQTHQQAGYITPQSEDRLPHGTPAGAPVAAVRRPAGEPLTRTGPFDWIFGDGWRLLDSTVASPPAPAKGAEISRVGYTTGSWMAATVPGTVLTTLVDRGIYPDPDYGLNNLAIPESLNKHDWWYRTEFLTPAVRPGQRLQLRFAGINYAAEIWLNGTRLGEIRGAFKRGVFDIPGMLRPGVRNALAVRISPPPHPGIPHEQSMIDGPGENGGAMLIDGPTFVATEGWDWIPAIRDRNSGLWQAVTLHATGSVVLGDPQVITRLPLPQTSSADVELDVPLHNDSRTATPVIVSAEFEGVAVKLRALAAPGDCTLRLSSARFPQLHLQQPRLWWPNGYGSPELYHLKLQLRTVAGNVEDERSLRFGVREITHELSLFDHAGQLQRVEAFPEVTLGKGYDAVDVHHAGMRQTATGWSSTIGPEAEGTPAVLPVSDEPELSDLVIKVNGVRIAVRGGNWGMDDARKRVSREHLEPFFRLHREANLNIVRNWVGQDTEETFYDLADEYGMLIWNDFWASTQNYNAEPGDVSLFVDNARDVVRRDRNHPSIALWCGRNEGVPPPALNDALIEMLRQEDGTRFYSPSSNVVNLRNSGPYSWTDPALYFSKLNRGFSVELGISSFPTREAFEAAVAPADRWPISDAWAYHDWHQAGGGDTHELMRHVEAQLGPANSLPEFEKRIQLFNYVDHQAIFEGFYQHLWTPNSGRMIWMTHPAWPSTMWQMYSSDYDTQASFYAIKKANAPLHVQMDLSDGSLAVVNTTRQDRPQLRMEAVAYSPTNTELARVQRTLSASSNHTTPAGMLSLPELFSKAPLAFVRLTLRDVAGALVADNFYWIAKEEEDFRAMDDLASAQLQLSAHQETEPARADAERSVKVQLVNAGPAPAIATKLTLLTASGRRVLPAYYSDNYVSLLPGESRTVSIQVPQGAVPSGPLHIAVRGWNVVEASLAVEP